VGNLIKRGEHLRGSDDLLVLRTFHVFGVVEINQEYRCGLRVLHPVVDQYTKCRAISTYLSLRRYLMKQKGTSLPSVFVPPDPASSGFLLQIKEVSFADVAMKDLPIETHVPKRCIYVSTSNIVSKDSVTFQDIFPNISFMQAHAALPSRYLKDLDQFVADGFYHSRHLLRSVNE
jgi:hypothetical protein